MILRTSFVLKFLAVVAAFPAIADPQIWYEYSSGKGVPKITEIKGATELALIVEGCQPDILYGTIENVDFRRGQSIVEGFNLRRADGFVEYIGLEQDYIDKLGKIDTDWLVKLVAPKKTVLVMASRCGVSGRNLYARDIYSAGRIKSLLSRLHSSD